MKTIATIQYTTGYTLTITVVGNETRNEWTQPDGKLYMSGIHPGVVSFIPADLLNISNSDLLKSVVITERGYAMLEVWEKEFNLVHPFSRYSKYQSFLAAP